MLLATNTYEAYKLKGVYHFNYKNTGFDVYRTQGTYPITIVLNDLIKPLRSGTLIIPQDTQYQLWRTLLSVADYWSEVINNTDASFCREPVYIPFYDVDGNMYTDVNPLRNEDNNGLTINVCGIKSHTESYGKSVVNLTRARSSDKNTKTYLIPYHCTLVLNQLKFEDACTDKPYINANNPDKQFFRVPFEHVIDGFEYVKDNIWYLLAHQICHCLGFGTMWYVRNYKGRLIRSFIVGASDNCSNKHNNPRLNFFYSTQSKDNTRDSKTDLAIFLDDKSDIVRVGDASFTDAFNGFSLIKNFISNAVYSFNKTFNTNVSAIPVENNGTEDTIGTHWDEGHTFNAQTKEFNGTDRKYYNKPIQSISNELMSTTLNVYKPSPITNITLGALQDLGYTINLSQAERIKPLVYNVHCNDVRNTNTTITTDDSTLKILGYSPYNVFIPGQQDTTLRDWINSPPANLVNVIASEENSQRYYSDPRNTPLVCRRGFTYTFNCHGTITSQEPSLVLITAKNPKLSHDNTRVFDIVDDKEKVVSKVQILRDGITTITLSLPQKQRFISDSETPHDIYWLRLGVKKDKALLNKLNYNVDSINYTFTSLLPIYIYG